MNQYQSASIVLSELDPSGGVPDALAEALRYEPSTDEELWVGRVLGMHRDWLNGGFSQVLHNLAANEEYVALYVEAYRKVGLVDPASLLEKVADGYAAGTFGNDDWDKLDDQYGRFVYRSDENNVDSIEAAIIIFAQRTPDRFENAVKRSNELP
jgi:hypothetical protein